MSVRERLSNRRRSVVFDFDDAGISYRAQIFMRSDGHPSEIFLDGPKIGSSAQVAAHDAAVAASLALEFGCPADVLKHALLKLPNGSGAGPIGRALDMLQERE